MSDWWLLDDIEIEKDLLAKHNRQTAFFNVLYATDEGRLVLNTIREMCYASNNIDLITLYYRIRNIAGRTRETELSMIAAEAEAIQFQTAEEIEVQMKEGD